MERTKGEASISVKSEPVLRTGSGSSAGQPVTLRILRDPNATGFADKHVYGVLRAALVF